ncbi:hypothetical protein SKAU_G00180840 [Synaphobranchus kaupii]|uniref:Uncharacterized protein n=1 Tax=Synaphobranchus kaupii TaxID=118154 RepID=A0A9Q1IZI2_SYNKA|nr:hypothetical protein SKAU_G00180840 [Synaphobranchus kaupii]
MILIEILQIDQKPYGEAWPLIDGIQKAGCGDGNKRTKDQNMGDGPAARDVPINTCLSVSREPVVTVTGSSPDRGISIFRL